MTMAGQPLSVIAGGGAVPLVVARAAQAAGRPVQMIAFEGEADPAVADFPHHWLKWGQIGRLFDLIRNFGGTEVVIIGGINHRPDFRSIVPDLPTLRILPEILSIMTGGDDTALSGAVRMLEKRGFRVVGAHEIAADLVATPGCLTDRQPSAEHRREIASAIVAARTVGALDAGQAAVAIGEHIVAIEGAEGTDAMLERVRELRARKRISWRGSAGVLAKCAKPQQDLRIDMPTIGPATIDRVAAAGLAGVALEAGKVMLVDREETLRRANNAGLFMVAETFSLSEKNSK